MQRATNKKRQRATNRERRSIDLKLADLNCPVSEIRGIVRLSLSFYTVANDTNPIREIFTTNESKRDDRRNVTSRLTFDNGIPATME